MIRRTRSYHELSAPLTDKEICKRAEEMGVKTKLSFELVRDIVNVITHLENGSSAENALLPPSEWLGLSLNEKELMYHKKVQNFLVESQHLMRKATGADSLTKALNFIAMLASLSGGEPAGAQGDTLPIFNNQSVSDIVRKLEELFESLKQLGDLELEMLELDGNSPEQNIYKLSQRQELEIARIARLLKKNIKFALPVTRVFVPNPSGTKTAKTQMSEYSQVSKLAPVSQLAMPDFEYKFVRKSLTVKVKGDYKVDKQHIYMLIDQSESMRRGDRWKKALAVLLNRLGEAGRGSASVNISFFDDKITQEFNVSTKSEALELFRKFRGYTPKGNGTMIDKSIREVVSRIMQEKQRVRPELVLVTDGDDVSTLTFSELRGVKLHYISIEYSPNKNLAQLATASGGIFLHI